MMAPPSRPTRIIGRMVMSLFGLVFLCIGLVIGYFLALPDLQTWNAAKGFVPVQAQLLDVTLDRHRGKKSTTYEVRARYRYIFDGRAYQSTRVGIASGTDNIGDYQERMYDELRAAQRAGREVVAWVNPREPSEALLDRDMRWGLFGLKAIFAVVFSLAGLGIAIAALRAPRANTGFAPNDLAWLSRFTRRDGRIVSQARKDVWMWWGFALFWNLVSLPMLFLLPHEIEEGNWPAAIGFIFPIIGAWMLYQATVKALQWKRFGELTLTLVPTPAVIGSAVEGYIELPGRFPLHQMFRITLTCSHRRTTGSGRNRRTTDTKLWQGETTATVESTGRNTRLSFRFDVPAGLPASEPPSNDYRHWTIHAGAELEGADLDQSFEIPVVAGLGAAAAPAARMHDIAP